jgi:hypothetical protein
VFGGEITLSPTHTAGRAELPEGMGLALRFPRFTGRWRPDKGPQDATTDEEILEMYRRRAQTERHSGAPVQHSSANLRHPPRPAPGVRPPTRLSRLRRSVGGSGPSRARR